MIIIIIIFKHHWAPRKICHFLLQAGLKDARNKCLELVNFGMSLELNSANNKVLKLVGIDCSKSNKI